MTARIQIIKNLQNNKLLAHEFLFKGRHPNITPPFHDEVILDAHSPTQKLIQMAFRGGGKSSIVGEEYAILNALFGEFKNCIIVGSSEKRAVERLRAIKHELISNESINQIFGDMKGTTWNEERIELKKGIVMQAVGRGQSLRGVKHLDHRPDLCIVDDFEDEETVNTPDAREKTLVWFMKVLMPALDMNARIRVIGTPLDPESVLMRLSNEDGWMTRTYPIEYIDEEGQRAPTWPDRFPLEWVDDKRASHQRLGIMREFMQEYMCEASDPATKSFRAGMVRVEPVVRTWQAVYVMIDPARTVNQKSAHTGCAVWSWINNRLVVWEAWGRFLMPDEIVQELFRLNDEYRPVILGIEKDGLAEFLMQPIRQEMIKRGIGLPIDGVMAPRDRRKEEFIRGLQPFFVAREIIFAKPLPDLESQLLNFPTGRIDVANALAYALKMRPGRPVYDDFTQSNIHEQLKPYGDSPLWLILHGNKNSLVGVVAQYGNGSLRVLWDKVMEGEPGEKVGDMLSEASMLYRGLKLIGPPIHFDQWRNINLKQSLARANQMLIKGGDEKRGKEAIRKLLREQVHGLPSLRISTEARWTLNALSGGYARRINPDMSLGLEPEDGPYKLVMEGIESLMGNVIQINNAINQDDNNANWAYTKDGKRYRSALVQH